MLTWRVVSSSVVSSTTRDFDCGEIACCSARQHSGVQVLSFDALLDRARGHRINPRTPMRPTFHHLMAIRGGQLDCSVDFTEHQLLEGELIWVKPPTRDLIKSIRPAIAEARVIAEAAVYDELVQLISTMLSFVNVGDPLEKATMMGPVVSEAAADRIIAMIERARQHSRLVAGGERLAGDHAAGHFIPPTVFVDVDTDLEISQQEVFGPVDLAVHRFRRRGALGQRDALRARGISVD